MKKTGNLLLSFLLMLSCILSGVSFGNSVKAADEPYSVTYPSLFEGSITIKLSDKKDNFDWVKVYTTTYNENIDTGDLTLNKENELVESIDSFDDVQEGLVDENGTPIEVENAAYEYSVRNWDYITTYVRIDFKLKNNSKTYTVEWNRPDESTVKPTITKAEAKATEQDGYYNIDLTCNVGTTADRCEIVFLYVYDENNNLIDKISCDDFYDTDIENGVQNITYSSLLGGNKYKFIVENTYGVQSDAFTAEQMKDAKIPDEFKDADTSNKNTDTKKSVTLKVTKKVVGDVAPVTAKTNKKCTIYVDGVYKGKTKNNKLSFNLNENGTYTIRAVDSKGAFTEKKIKITGLKYDKSKAPKVTSREAWNNSSENNSKLPQTGTIALSAVLAMALVLGVAGIIVYKKRKELK